MTPTDFDPEVVQAKLRLLDELRDLAEVGTVSGVQLRSDRLTRYATERMPTQLVETGVSVNTHLAATLTGGPPAITGALSRWRR